jgi:hypothetical protein
MASGSRHWLLFLPAFGDPDLHSESIRFAARRLRHRALETVQRGCEDRVQFRLDDIVQDLLKIEGD